MVDDRAQEIGFAPLPLSAARGCRHLVVRMEGNWDRAYNGFPTFLLFSSLENIGERTGREKENQHNSRVRKRCKRRCVFVTKQLNLVFHVL